MLVHFFIINNIFAATYEEAVDRLTKLQEEKFAFTTDSESGAKKKAEHIIKTIKQNNAVEDIGDVSVSSLENGSFNSQCDFMSEDSTGIILNRNSV